MITSGTPYSLENFKWLMQHPPVRSYLGDDIQKNIRNSINNGNEEYLKRIYPIILELYLKTKESDDKFQKNHEQTIADLTKRINETEKHEKEARKVRNQMVENREKEDADNLLNKLNP